MTKPPLPCPQPQSFPAITGFLTPGSDTGPGALDASISLDVLDPTENNEPVRAVEVTDPWDLEVELVHLRPLRRPHRWLLVRTGLH